MQTQRAQPANTRLNENQPTTSNPTAVQHQKAHPFGILRNSVVQLLEMQTSTILLQSFPGKENTQVKTPTLCPCRCPFAKPRLLMSRYFFNGPAI